MKHYLGKLAARDRDEASDRHLAYYLTFIAGAANAGGFMAVHQYTSHMSGIVSAMADNAVLGDGAAVAAGFLALIAFILGAAASAIMINWGRRRGLHAQYALPLLTEAMLFVGFAVTGVWDASGPPTGVAVIATVSLLCFIMGFQNAIITKLSGARIRTTHITGLVTDAGIELGKGLYWNRAATSRHQPPVRADLPKLRLLSSLIALFFIGGVIGAVLFKHIGFTAALTLAVPLAILAAAPVIRDLQESRNRG
ncbi:YoaK family protein [Rhizobium sp. RU36D]|uniref:YoaK family protein n=1 Tax=Rhizobium sp. RU36D TaxID=1907415 RepID=UPI0009D8C8A3|nr:YoaK family protein [Rhizobium sp. RU36D]SMD00194.1 Uncharacterized membrane protein YoaK, UPF0700 family [Rhizobium sp. RU36D]